MAYPPTYQQGQPSNDKSKYRQLSATVNTGQLDAIRKKRLDEIEQKNASKQPMPIHLADQIAEDEQFGGPRSGAGYTSDQAGKPILDTSYVPISNKLVTDELGNTTTYGNAIQERDSALAARGRFDPMAEFEKGRVYGQKVVPQGVLGRMSTTVDPNLQAVLNRRRQMMESYQPNARLGQVLNMREANLGGYTPAEMESYRQQQQVNANQTQQGNLRQLMQQQAASGVRGPAAMAQRARMQQEFGKAATERERDLFLKQLEEKRRALDLYRQDVEGVGKYEAGEQERLLGGLEGTAKGMGETARDIEKYNIGQSGKELEAQLGTAAALAQMAAAERAGQRGEALSKEQMIANNKLIQDLYNKSQGWFK